MTVNERLDALEERIRSWAWKKCPALDTVTPRVAELEKRIKVLECIHCFCRRGAPFSWSKSCCKCEKLK